MCVVDNFAQFFFEFYVILCWEEMIVFCYLSVLVFPLCFLDFVSYLERHFPFQDFLLICSYFLLYLQPGYLKFNFFDPSKSYIDLTGKEEFSFIFFSQLS